MRVRRPFYAPDEPPAGGGEAAPAGGSPAPEPAPAGDSSPAPAPTGGTPAGSAPAPEPASAPDPYDDSAVQQFDRAYVEKLRRESQGLREKHAPFRDTFGSYSEEDQQAWLWLAKTYNEDPKAAAEAMQALAKSLLEGDEPAPAAPAGADPAADVPLTRAEYEKLKADEQKQAEHARIVADVNAHMAKLGYQPDTPESNNLLWLAMNQADGDLDKAHELVQAQRQAIIDEYLNAKTQEAQGSRRVRRDAGVAPGERPAGPKTMDEAKAAADARIARAFQAS